MFLLECVSYLPFYFNNCVLTWPCPLEPSALAGRDYGLFVSVFSQQQTCGERVRGELDGVEREALPASAPASLPRRLRSLALGCRGLTLRCTLS